MFTQLSQKYIKQGQGPAGYGGEHAEHPSLARSRRGSAPSWSQPLYMFSCEVLVGDFQVTSRRLGRNSMFGCFMVQYNRHFVL